MKPKELAKYFDHTELQAFATKNTITSLLNEAIEYQFGGVCIHPCWVKYASDYLKARGYSGELVTVVGFPLGANTTTTKVFETKDAIVNGATEIDMVINIGKLKDGDFEYLSQEIKMVTKAAGAVPVKVIIENCYLTTEEKVQIIKILQQSSVSFAKTSTGFGTGGATIEDLKFMDENRGNLKLKAAGGVKTLSIALDMVKSGADRIGASSSVAILKELVSANSK